MVAVHLSHYLGGNLMLGFMSAVTFATILAVVAGLTLAGAATIAHDLYAKTIAKEKVTEKTAMRISRISVLILGLISILLGVAFETQNIAYVVAMALAIAASVNAPILIAAMYWKNLTTRGAVAGGVVGLVSSIVLIILGPNVMVGAMGYEQAIFPYTYPTVISLPLAFISLWFFSITDKSKQGEAERAAFDEQFVRSETGIGIAESSSH
jgi:cation/acetate symporter